MVAMEKLVCLISASACPVVIVHSSTAKRFPRVYMCRNSVNSKQLPFIDGSDLF